MQQHLLGHGLGTASFTLHVGATWLTPGDILPSRSPAGPRSVEAVQQIVKRLLACCLWEGKSSSLSPLCCRNCSPQASWPCLLPAPPVPGWPSAGMALQRPASKGLLVQGPQLGWVRRQALLPGDPYNLSPLSFPPVAGSSLRVPSANTAPCTKMRWPATWIASSTRSTLSM